MLCSKLLYYGVLYYPYYLSGSMTHTVLEQELFYKHVTNTSAANENKDDNMSLKETVGV